MADITDNYIIVGADTDNFNCDSVDGWGKGGNAEDPTTQDTRLEGDKSIGLTTSDKDESWWYHDISEDYRFKITEKDLGFWFFYLKGKSDNYLVQDSTAVVLRLYFGGTDKYADYRLTEKGDLSLTFGWQMLMCSGTNLRGGDVGGGHDGDSDFYLDIYRIELRLNAANKIDHSLLIDAFFIGNEITISDGTEDNPITELDLHNYTNIDREGFPIGTCTLLGNLFVMNSTLTIADGYTHLSDRYILHDQLSKEVTHNLNITKGMLKIGIIDDYGNTFKGCTITKPDEYSADIEVSDTGVLEVYSSKLLKYTKVNLSSNSIISTSTLSDCDLLELNNDNIRIDQVKIKNCTTILCDHALEINSNCNLSNIKVFNCKSGIKINVDIEIDNIALTDNDDYDIIVLDEKAISLIESTFSSMKREE